MLHQDWHSICFLFQTIKSNFWPKMFSKSKRYSDINSLMTELKSLLKSEGKMKNNKGFISLLCSITIMLIYRAFPNNKARLKSLAYMTLQEHTLISRHLTNLFSIILIIFQSILSFSTNTHKHISKRNLF